ncbi:MAG TPA: hypothetical protein VN903_36300 [Polyangia bacterium]|nr:hypothetical protein [Polyangia bacterium]
MTDPTTRIIDEYLNLPVGEAILLHRVIGVVLERMGDGMIAAATVVRPRKLAGIHVARSVPETDPAAEAASITSPAPRRRRRRTRAEMAGAGQIEPAGEPVGDEPPLPLHDPATEE